MKKKVSLLCLIIAILLISLTLNNGEYEKAEQERINRINSGLTEVGDEIKLSTLTETDSENCCKVEIGLFGKNTKYEIDGNEFFTLADGIGLVDIENILVMDTEGGLVIRCYDDSDVHEVTVWDNCAVAGRRVSMHSAPTGDYIMKAEDFNKLLSLLPQEAQQKLPPVKSLYANFVYWFTYNSTTAYAVGAIILVALICIIVFAIRKRRKKLK